MKLRQWAACAAAIGLLWALPPCAKAAGDPAPKAADWTAKDFRFHDGQVLPELPLH